MSHPVTPGNDGSHADSGSDSDRREFDDRLGSTTANSAGTEYPAVGSAAAASEPTTPPMGTDLPDRDRDFRASTVGVEPQYVSPAPTVVVRESDPADLLTQEKDEFGGIKFGTALLGWLTTVGTIAVLAAILAAIASGLNLDSKTSSADLKGVGLGAAIALLVVLFLGYLAGGYVAGRMARFHGIRQGLAVWLWGVVIAIALSITAAIVGKQSTVLVQANLPQIPFTSSGFTWQAILALVAVLVVTLLGALLGGLWGMRFHRRIDKFAANTDAV